MDFFKLYDQVKKNVEYWSRNIMINTNHGIDKDDAFQELIIIIFNEWSKKEKVTKYYIQRRLYYANLRILRNFYLNNETKLNPIYIETLKTQSDDGEEYDYEIFNEDEIEQLLDKLELDGIFEELIYKLGSEGLRAKAILEMLIAGMSLNEIARELKMKKSNVYRIKEQKIKKTLKILMNKS